MYCYWKLLIKKNPKPNSRRNVRWQVFFFETDFHIASCRNFKTALKAGITVQQYQLRNQWALFEQVREGAD
jgi:hypothetical protein